MTTYLQQIKDIVDSLAHTGEPLDNADVVAHTLFKVYHRTMMPLPLQFVSVKSQFKLRNFVDSYWVRKLKYNAGEKLLCSYPQSQLKFYNTSLSVFNPPPNVTWPNYHFQGTRCPFPAPNRNKTFNPDLSPTTPPAPFFDRHRHYFSKPTLAVHHAFVAKYVAAIITLLWIASIAWLCISRTSTSSSFWGNDGNPTAFYSLCSTITMVWWLWGNSLHHQWFEQPLHCYWIQWMIFKTFYLVWN